MVFLWHIARHKSALALGLPCLRRVSRLKMKLIQAPPGSPRGAFCICPSPLHKYVAAIVSGPLLSHDLALSNWQRARTQYT